MFLKRIRVYIRRVLDIRTGSGKEETLAEISSGVSLKGFNFWMIVCSALIASLGLDTNSTAVIIGAMLISPLMNPILGVGLSLGINDRELFFLSLKNLGIATFAGFFASVIYFKLTPFGNVTSEMVARTTPTLLDVLIAFFGGVAGIVSGTRKYKTNAIPGVAIATALMPPLCTSGFGFATGRWDFFLGAFYLFFINAVFISLATFLIIKYLKFPVKTFLDKAKERKNRRYMIAFLILVVSPSIYFLYTTYMQLNEKNKIDNILDARMSKDSIDMLRSDIIRTDSVNYVNIYHTGKILSPEKKKIYDSLLQANDLHNFKMNFKRLNMSKDEVVNLSKSIVENYIKDIEQKAKQISDSLKGTSLLSSEQIEKETKYAFPEIKIENTGILSDSIATVMYSFKKVISLKDEETISDNFYNFLKVRYNKDTLILIKNPKTKK